MSKLYTLFSVLFIIFFLASCEKNTDAGSNKAYLSITHVAPNAQPFDAILAGSKLTTDGKISFGSTSGIAENSYLTGISGTQNLRVTPDGTNYYLDGNLFLHIGNHYSVFIYDTLQNGKLKALALNDELNAPVDTMASMRFLDFVPDTALLAIAMINATDTIILGQQSYVGINPLPAIYSNFNNVKSGRYNILIAVDSTIVFNDSLSLDGGKLYTVFTQGFLNGSGATALRLGKIEHN